MDNEQEYGRIPLIRLWNILLVPLQGEVTDEMAARLSADVLERIHETGASGLVLDITGVWMVDSHLCSVLSNLASSASLVGATSIISGMSPEIAVTLQTMGAELRGARTALTVEEAFEVLGVRAARAENLRPRPGAPATGVGGARQFARANGTAGRAATPQARPANVTKPNQRHGGLMTRNARIPRGPGGGSRRSNG